MEGNKPGFLVKIKENNVVVPLKPIQEQHLPQSNLDLLFPPLYVSVFFCYQKPTSGETFSSMVSVLKKALAQTLVSYYPFAGEMVQNLTGEPMLLCNNRGVDFIEAFADIELQELDFYKPDDTVAGKLLPCIKQGLLAIQATELKCGGLVVACTFDHQIADAYTANLFLVSWSEMARVGLLSSEPSFGRSLLNPRSSFLLDPSMGDFYMPLSTLPTREHDLPDRDEGHTSRIYYVPADQIKRLQAAANENNWTTTNMWTKYEAFSAFLWKTTAKGITGGSNNACRLAITVDGRKRFSNSTLMSNYFGNVVSVPFCKAKTDELKNMPLSWAANMVHKLIEQTATREHFQGLVDYVETYRPERTAIRVCVDRATLEEPAYVVSSGQRFPVTKIDFGWGGPAFGSYYFPWAQKCGYVMPMPSAGGNGDWVVYMYLLKPQLDAVETHASHFFKPMKSAYF